MLLKKYNILIIGEFFYFINYNTRLENIIRQIISVGFFYKSYYA